MLLTFHHAGHAGIERGRSARSYRAGDQAAAGTAARAIAVAKSVTINRDTFGVPHVYGPTDASCVFGFIYAQAEDYFWQIEDSYIRSLGRAAEFYGEKSLPDDLVNRALEITRISKEEYETASPKTKEICRAIADGLNYFLAVNPQVKPRLITHFEPWHPEAFRRFILYQSFIYGKSGLQASDILSAVQEVKDSKVGAITFPAELRALILAMEQDWQSMSEHVGFKHVGRESSQVGFGQSTHVHQSAPAFLRARTVVRRARDQRRRLEPARSLLLRLAVSHPGIQRQRRLEPHGQQS